MRYLRAHYHNWFVRAKKKMRNSIHYKLVKKKKRIRNKWKEKKKKNDKITWATISISRTTALFKRLRQFEVVSSQGDDIDAKKNLRDEEPNIDDLSDDANMRGKKNICKMMTRPRQHASTPKNYQYQMLMIWSSLLMQLVIKIHSQIQWSTW